MRILMMMIIMIIIVNIILMIVMISFRLLGQPLAEIGFTGGVDVSRENNYLHSAKGGAVEAGCSDLYDIIY